MNDFEFSKEILEAEKYLNQVSDSFLDKQPKTSSSITSSVTNNNNIKSYQHMSSSDSINNILTDYKRRLKIFGFPDMGDITLSDDITEQEKTLKFLDFILLKKANESQDYKKYQSQSESLVKKAEAMELQISKYEKEISKLTNEIKTLSKSKKEYENKLSKVKTDYEKQITSIKNANTYLQNKLTKLTLDKRVNEEKLTKISEAYSKITTSKTKSLNSIELIEQVKQNDLCKMLSKLKGTEKLIEMLKDGYNESHREMLYEINSLKEFVFGLHNDIKSLIEIPCELNDNLREMTFLDCANEVKLVFNKNIMLIRAKMGFDYDYNGNYQEISEIQCQGNGGMFINTTTQNDDEDDEN